MISVLYVDDESALLEVTKDFMERGGGFKVDTAISAREAIEKLKAERYDALVADYLMPEMDGLELLKYLHPRCNGMPFILFTGKGGEEVAIEALNSGADFYVQKKGSPRTQFAELETRIRSAVARRQSEVALRTSEEEFRLLVEHLADIVFTVNEEGIVTYISPRIHRFGYDQKDLIGRDFAMLVSAEDIPAVAHQFADVKQGMSLSWEFRIADKGGQLHRVRASCCPRTDRGQFIGAEGVISDITDAKNDTDMVSGRTDLRQQIFDLTPDGIMVIDPGTGIPVTFNDEACHQLGYTREEFSGLSVEDWEVAGASQTIREMMSEIMQKGQATFGTRHRAKDGRILEISVKARVLADGVEKKIGLILHDTSGENEERGWGEIFEEAPFAQLTLLSDGRISRINRACVELMGCPAQEIIGSSLAEFIDNSEQARFSESLGELERSGSVRAVRFTLLFHDGRSILISLNGRVIRGSDGEIHQLLVTLTDITGQERKMADLEELAITAGAVIAGAREGIIVCTPDQRITGWNPAMEDITGIGAPDALGQLLAGTLPFLQETGTDAPERALAGEIVATPDVRYTFSATGKRGWARAIFSPLRDTSGKITGIIGVVQEITARTKSLLRVKAARWLYAISAQISATATAVRELETLLAETCRIAVDGDTVSMAWIGLFDHTAGILRPVAQAGTGGGLPTEGYPVTGADPVGCLAGDAVRTGAPLVSSDTGTDPAAEPWRDGALRDGYQSEASIPFRLNGELVGVMTLCSGEPYAFSAEDTEALDHLGSTLSSALDLLDKKTLQRRAGRGGHGSWERTRFLAAGIESAVVPFAAVYADGGTGVVNAALCTLLGYSEDELLSTPFPRLLDQPDDGEERFCRVLAANRPERFESGVRKKDGTHVYAELFLQVIPDETSRQPCVGVFLTDITDRKQRTDALEKDRQKYFTFFKESAAAIVIATPEGTILATNPAACRLLGRAELELCPAVGGGFSGEGDPRFVELVRTCGVTGSATGELRLVRGDGTAFDADVEAARFLDQDGRPVMSLVLRDITGSKKSVDTLEKVRDATMAILNGLPNPIRRSDVGGASRFFNRAWFAFTGRTSEDEREQGWMEGIHPDDRDRYRESVRIQGDSGASSETEYRLRHHSGEYRWIREVRIPDAASDETEDNLICSCYDIHACRQAEEALDKEKAQHRAVFESTADATLLVSDRILECNAAATRLFACTREDLIGHGPLDYSPRYQPDGRASADAVQEYIETAREGMPQVFPWVSMRSDGTTLETKVTLTTLDLHGERRLLAVIDDVTEQNRAEHEIQRLAAYPEMNPNPVIEVQPDRTISYANPATAAVLSSLGLPDDPTAFLPADFDEIAGTLDPEQPMMTGRVVQIKERSFHESICAVPGHAPIRIYAYDITDRVQAMEALAYANHKLGILTSITRHDIQNKLTGVLGYLDLLRGSLRDPQLLDFLDKAESSAEAIRHHIDFTKDYESLGGTTPVWQEITPILADVRSHFDVGGIVFEEPAPGFAVFADPMFAKVLYNLCDNSVRHGVHVRHIRIHCEPYENGCMLVYEDDGVGIPQDKKELIFERGFTTSSGSGKSSGLGLFLARDILAITGISIKETGVPGMGSRFEMVIPPGKWRNGPVD